MCHPTMIAFTLTTLSNVKDGDQTDVNLQHNILLDSVSVSVFIQRRACYSIKCAGERVFICSRILVSRISALDKLLGQLGTYATWLSSIAYLQNQLRTFIFFTPRFFSSVITRFLIA